MAGGLERVLRMEVGVVLPLVLTTSCGEREEGERREERERERKGRSRMEEKNSKRTTHISLGTNTQQTD